jgi:hypothetical protein
MRRFMRQARGTVRRSVECRTNIHAGRGVLCRRVVHISETPNTSRGFFECGVTHVVQQMEGNVVKSAGIGAGVSVRFARADARVSAELWCQRQVTVLGM